MNTNTVTFAARDFWRRRGASDEHTLQRSERSEQRSLRQKELPPGGLRRIWPVASLLVGYSPLRGCALLAPRHRPNWAQRRSPYLCLRPLKNTSTKPTLILDLRALQTFDRITLIRRRAAQSFKNFC